MQHFTDEETLTKMNKVGKTKAAGTKRFKDWLALGKKAKLPSKAWCCRHLKQCRPHFRVFSAAANGFQLECNDIYIYIYIGFRERKTCFWDHKPFGKPARPIPIQAVSARCPIRSSFLDCSGSMCTAFSTLGNLDKNEDLNARLLIIYMVFHFKRKTPIVLHENVAGFVAESMSDLAAAHGYAHVKFRCRPMDVGVHVGRPRRC